MSQAPLKMIWCERNRAKMSQRVCDGLRKEQSKLKTEVGQGSIYKGIAYNGCKDCPGGTPIPDSEVKKMTEEIEKGLEVQQCSMCRAREVNKNLKSREWSLDGKSGVGLCWRCYSKVPKAEKKTRDHRKPPVRKPVSDPAPQTKSIIVTNKTLFKLLTGSYSRQIISSNNINSEVKDLIDEASGLVDEMNEKGWGCELEISLRIQPKKGA